MKLGKYAIERSYFEHDDEFPDSIKSVLDGYDKAARQAAFLLDMQFAVVSQRSTLRRSGGKRFARLLRKLLL